MSGFRRLRAVALALAALLASGCGEDTPGPEPVTPAPVEPKPVEAEAGDADATVPAGLQPPVEGAPSSEADVARVVEGNGDFAFDLYAKLRSNRGNLVFSPYSISTALAMTYAGARGETAAEMHRVLGLPSDKGAEHLPPPEGGGPAPWREIQTPWKQERLHAAMSALVADLNVRGGRDGGEEDGGACELVVANRLWGQSGYRFLDTFLALNRKYYGAGLEQVDFARETERAREKINGWVEEQTREKIRELLKPGVLTPLTTLVLANAIYFKGSWASEFDRKRTTDAPFLVTPEREVDVPMMRRTARFGLAETRDVQVLEMPYVGGDLSMVVVLPRKVDGLGEVEASLGSGGLKAWLSGLRERKVAVYLPRFRAEFGVDLAKTLAAMGMPGAFGAGADFSGMDGTRSLFISAVIHKAYVDVNEEGTEAAAATAVVMPRNGSGPPVFLADRPFLFLIRDRATGSVLFLGRVADPSA